MDSHVILLEGDLLVHRHEFNRGEGGEESD